MKKITFVETSVVGAIYIGNELFFEEDAARFNIPLMTDLLNTLEIPYEVEYVQDVEDRLDDHINEAGQLPETLREVNQILGGD